MFLGREKLILQLEGVVQDHLLGGGLLVESVKNDHKGFQLPSISSCLLPMCAGFPKRWVQPAYVVFCPLRRGSPVTTSHLFFFVEAILTQATVNPSDTSVPDKPLSSLLFSSVCRASGR